MPDDYEDYAEIGEDSPAYEVDGFHSLESARFAWPDAPWQNSILSDLLEVAKDQVLAYAPADPTDIDDGVIDGGDAGTDFTVPTRYRVAQLLQVRNIWNVSKIDTGSGDMGEGSFTISPFPMDRSVKNLIRPKSPVPVMF